MMMLTGNEPHNPITMAAIAMRYGEDRIRAQWWADPHHEWSFEDEEGHLRGVPRASHTWEAATNSWFEGKRLAFDGDILPDSASIRITLNGNPWIEIIPADLNDVFGPGCRIMINYR